MMFWSVADNCKSEDSKTFFFFNIFITVFPRSTLAYQGEYRTSKFKSLKRFQKELNLSPFKVHASDPLNSLVLQLVCSIALHLTSEISSFKY